MSDQALPTVVPTLHPPLTLRTRHGLGTAGAALLLGVAGDALLRPAPWGVNLTLWCILLVGLSALLQRWTRTPDAAAGWMPVALSLALLMAWRDSPTLKALDLTALAVVLGLALVDAAGGRIRVAGVGRYAVGMGYAVLQTLCGAGLLAGRDLRWAELRRGGRSALVAAGVRGVLLAAPLLLLFGTLLRSADAGFDRLLGGLFAFDLSLTLSHLALATLIGWLAAGVLRALALAPPAGDDIVPQESRMALGVVETVTVLGLLDLLFLGFVLLQLPHFFGSYGVLLARGSTTFSDYARRGFFELCAVAAMALPLLLALHWLVRDAAPRGQRAFRLVAGGMVGLVAVIILSALHRMRLYQLAYGLTELRVYTTACMLWLSAVFAWFTWTVLRGRRERFAFGALTAAVETVVLLHVVNPDALIVRVNAGRTQAPVRFDAVYAASLSGDAVPQLLPRLGTLPAQARCELGGRLLRRWSGEGEDWRAWSLGRSRALAAVRAHRGELSSGCVRTVTTAEVSSAVVSRP